MLCAGHETTATTTAAVLYCVATHPEVQAGVFSELDSVLGGAQPLQALKTVSLPLIGCPAWSPGRLLCELTSLQCQAVPAARVVGVMERPARSGGCMLSTQMQQRRVMSTWSSCPTFGQLSKRCASDDTEFAHTICTYCEASRIHV